MPKRSPRDEFPRGCRLARSGTAPGARLASALHLRPRREGSGLNRRHGRRVALIGLMGSGKTTVGRKLARLIGYRFVDMDREIARAAGRSIARIFREEGEAGFRRREAELLRSLARDRNVCVSTGGGVVCLERNRRLLTTRFATFWLRIGVEEAWGRLGRPDGRPLLDSAHPLESLRAFSRRRNALYRATGREVRTLGRPPEALARAIAGCLNHTPAAPAPSRRRSASAREERRGVGKRARDDFTPRAAVRRSADRTPR
jgi:shikimate kinase